MTAGRKLKFGLIMDDGERVAATLYSIVAAHCAAAPSGVIPPTPANTRALLEVASALAKLGHEIVPL